MRQGSLHTVNDGQLRVVEYINAGKVLIRFIETGYIRWARAGDIRSKKVKDFNKPTVSGVGYLSKGRFKANSQAYFTWHNMLQRCYSKTYQKVYNYWEDCTVCDEWLNFQNFAGWFEKNYIKGFDLDKDCKVLGNRVYSPEFCSYIPQAKNRSTQTSTNRKRK